MTVDGFSLTKHSLSQRTESALKSLLFSSPLHPLPLCPNRDELSCRSRMGSTYTVRRKSVESLQDIHWQSKSISLLQGRHYGAVGRGAYQMETTVLCQFRFDPATMREAAMEMSYDGMPLKISSFYHLSQNSMHWSSVAKDASSHYMWQVMPQPQLLQKPSGWIQLQCKLQTAQSVKPLYGKIKYQLWVKHKTVLLYALFNKHEGTIYMLELLS